MSIPHSLTLHQHFFLRWNENFFKTKSNLKSVNDVRTANAVLSDIEGLNAMESNFDVNNSIYFKNN